MLESKCSNLNLGINFMTLNFWNYIYFFIFLEFIIHFKASSQKFVETVKLIRKLLVQYHLLAHHLHCLLKFVDFSWNSFCHPKLLGVVYTHTHTHTHTYIKVYGFFSSKNSKLVYSFESLSLTTRQESRVVHFTMLFLICLFKKTTLNRIFSVWL
jgi:hypothetical protein